MRAPTAAVLVLSVCACGETVELADGDGMDATTDGSMTCIVTQCDGRVLQCGNCVDDDEDGLADAHDPECLGPCDNTEGPALFANVGGEAGGPCLADCYFDFGNGSGNDDCHWDHRCDPLAVAPSYPPEGDACAYDPARLGSRDCPGSQSSMCLDYCRPLTPNGCDCFGCCTFDGLSGRSPSEGGEYVWIGSGGVGILEGTCTFEDLLDTEACQPCTPVADCFNDCGECELCIGRAELPASCAAPDAGTPYRCSEGIQACGLPGDSDCPADYFCVTGCCIQTII